MRAQLREQNIKLFFFVHWLFILVLCFYDIVQRATS